MRCARAHYVHVVCTSGHPLWQCCKQPIIYSTLISTHVNPHQSSQAWGYCYGSHTASWQNHLRRMGGHAWAWFEPAIIPGRFPEKGLQPALLSELIKKSQKKKVNRHNADRPQLFYFTCPRNTPEAMCFSITQNPNSYLEQKSDSVINML